MHLLAISLGQIVQPVWIAGRRQQTITEARTASAISRPKPFALPVTNHTLDIKISVLPIGCSITE